MTKPFDAKGTFAASGALLGMRRRNQLNKAGQLRLPPNMKGLPAISKGGLGGALVRPRKFANAGSVSSTGGTPASDEETNKFYFDNGALSSPSNNIQDYDNSEAEAVDSPTAQLLREITKVQPTGGGLNAAQSVAPAYRQQSQSSSSNQGGNDLWANIIQNNDKALAKYSDLVNKAIPYGESAIKDNFATALQNLSRPTQPASPLLAMASGLLSGPSHGGFGEGFGRGFAAYNQTLTENQKLALEQQTKQAELQARMGEALMQNKYAGLGLQGKVVDASMMSPLKLIGLQLQGQRVGQSNPDFKDMRKELTNINELGRSAPTLSALNEQAIEQIPNLPKTQLGVDAANWLDSKGWKSEGKAAMDLVQKDVKDQLLGGLKQFGSRIAQRYLTFLGDAYIQPGSTDEANYEAGFKTRIVLDRMQKLTDIANDIRQDPEVKNDPSLFDDKLWEAEKQLPDIQTELKRMMKEQKEGVGNKFNTHISKSDMNQAPSTSSANTPTIPNGWTIKLKE